MTFTRTKSGLQNYIKFYNADAIIYIEGRVANIRSDEVIEDYKSYDIMYYSSIFKLLSPYNNVKVKIVGSKSNVLDYHDKIIKNSIPYSYAVIDRDYDGILYSRINKEKLIYTYGYSWENDFWTCDLCLEVLKLISLDHDISFNIFKTKFNRSVKRVSLLNRINIISKYNGAELFPISVKGGDRGFRFDVASKFPLCVGEFKRISSKVESKILSDYNFTGLKDATNLSYNRLIQGHFFEYMMVNIVSYAYKLSLNHKNNILDITMIKNLAFNQFKLKPDFFLPPDALKHYTEQFERVIN